MKKIPTFMMILALSMLPLFSATYPVHSTIGQVADAESSHVLFIQGIMDDEFGFDWMETNVHEKYRKSFAAMHSGFFSETLPVKNVVVSEISKQGEFDVCGIIMGDGCYTVALLDGKIALFERL